MTLSLMLLLSINLAAPAAGNGFLHAVDGGGADDETLGMELIRAMDEVLGCGGHSTDEKRLVEIEAAIMPMWKTMPKLGDRMEWRSLRYIAHRYFMKQSSLLIRGLEPSRTVNDTDVGAAEILNSNAPAQADLLFGGANGAAGYTMDDAVALLAALERLVFDSETQLLERVYGKYDMELDRMLSYRQMKRLLEAYMVHWVLAEDTQGINILLRNRTLLEIHFPHWHAVSGYVEGRMKTLEFERTLALQEGSGREGLGQALMDKRYNFNDAHEVVGGITHTFQDFWQSECHTMKDQLVEMDKEGTGRVRLADFYGNGLNKDWRFGESEEYLRQLGVLDESSPWKGKQVIIPNYLQAASNCIVSSAHYLVCCMNECESLMGDIEEAVEQPTAMPETLLAIVGNMTSPSSANDEPPKLEGTLEQQLHKIAEAHGGEVPLHGRLFAQWLHYVFPRECPFPHKAGSFQQHTLTPHSYGDNFVATKEDMQAEAATEEVEMPEGTLDGEESLQDIWLSQWSEEEELFADYTGQLQAPWASTGRSMLFGAFVFIVAIVMRLTGVVGGAKDLGTKDVFCTKSQLV